LDDARTRATSVVAADSGVSLISDNVYAGWPMTLDNPCQ
jgi:hypothetical protein